MLRLALLSGRWGEEINDGRETLLAFLDYCRTLGLDGVDFNIFSFKRQDTDYLREVKLRCLHNGLSVPCLCLGGDFCVPETEQEAQIAQAKLWLDRAQFLGAPLVRIYTGFPPSPDIREAAWARAVRSIKQVADYGYEQGVLVSLQNQNNFHKGLVRTGPDVLRFVEEAGPHLGHVWDTGQYEGSPGLTKQPDAFHPATEEAYKSLEQTVHLATYVRAKTYWVETGVETSLDYPRVFSMLRSVNYNGFISIAYEGITEPHRSAVPKAVAYLRSVIAQQST